MNKENNNKLETLLNHIDIEEKDGELHIKCKSPIFLESDSHGVLKFNGSLVLMTDSNQGQLLYLNPTVSNYNQIVSTKDVIQQSHDSYVQLYNDYNRKQEDKSNKDCDDC